MDTNFLAALSVLAPLVLLMIWAAWKTYRSQRVLWLMRLYKTKDMDRTPKSRLRLMEKPD
jgi:uncharacterized membrane protein YqjE